MRCREAAQRRDQGRTAGRLHCFRPVLSSSPTQQTFPASVPLLRDQANPTACPLHPHRLWELSPWVPPPRLSHGSNCRGAYAPTSHHPGATDISGGFPSGHLNVNLPEPRALRPPEPASPPPAPTGVPPTALSTLLPALLLEPPSRGLSGAGGGLTGPLRPCWAAVFFTSGLDAMMR